MSTNEERTTLSADSDDKRIDNRFLTAVTRRLESGKPLRRSLPWGGRLHIDRELPFLCVYRRPSAEDDYGTARFVTGEASYLTAPGDLPRLDDLIRTVVNVLSEKFGAFLLVEIWAKPDSKKEADHRAIHVAPVFEVYGPGSNRLDSTIEVLARELGKVLIQKQRVRVDVDRGDGALSTPNPTTIPELPPNCHTLGVAIPPAYRNDAGETVDEYPQVLSSMRRRVGLALRRAFYEFSTRLTTHRPPHFHELGRRAVVKAVWQVDAQLAAVSQQFDYLLGVTPINTGRAWQAFKESRFEVPPEFHYLPLSFNPSLLKRELYRIPIERVEDPALSVLFQQKQDELDRSITMLRDRNTPLFLDGSRQLFGGVDEPLLERALQILGDGLGPDTRGEVETVDAAGFARAAQAEVDRYRESNPGFLADVEVTDKVAGVMVSRGHLLVGSDIRIARDRVDALIQHEVGTHLVTYYNGAAQPFRQLAAGLAGYEQLQEGLAVLAEYVVGGLNPTRVRQLAARVFAVRSVEDGADFLGTFRALVDQHDLKPRIAYNTAMRVHRGGGLTKDAIYLRGFDEVVALVQGGIDLDLLLYGKIAARHIGIVRELKLRGVLQPIASTPTYLDRPEVHERLQTLREQNAPIRLFRLNEPG